MKKLVSFILLLLCIFIFVGCSQPYYYSFEESMDKIEKVEILYINQFYPTEDIEIVKVLNNEEKVTLLTELSLIEFTYAMGPPNDRPQGICLRLYYNNQDIFYLNFNTSIMYYFDGRFGVRRIYCPEEVFNELISKYVDITNN